MYFSQWFQNLNSMQRHTLLNTASELLQAYTQHKQVQNTTAEQICIE